MQESADKDAKEAKKPGAKKELDPKKVPKLILEILFCLFCGNGTRSTTSAIRKEYGTVKVIGETSVKEYINGDATQEGDTGAQDNVEKALGFALGASPNSQRRVMRMYLQDRAHLRNLGRWITTIGTMTQHFCVKKESHHLDFVNVSYGPCVQKLRSFPTCSLHETFTVSTTAQAHVRADGLGGPPGDCQGPRKTTKVLLPFVTTYGCAARD